MRRFSFGATIAPQLLVAAFIYGQLSQRSKDQTFTLGRHNRTLEDNGKRLTDHDSPISHVEGSSSSSPCLRDPSLKGRTAGKRQAIFTKEEMRRRAALWGAMLWALAGYESSFGANCKPRHDPYYHDWAAKGINARLTALTARRAAMRIARLGRGRGRW